MCLVAMDMHQCCFLVLVRFSCVIAFHACFKVWDMRFGVMQRWPFPGLREGWPMGLEVAVEQKVFGRGWEWALGSAVGCSEGGRL